MPADVRQPPGADTDDPAAGPTADLAIIGAGPTGLFASFYAGLRHMSVLLIDSLEALGGQLVTLYPEKYVYDVAGFPKVLAKDLARSLVEQGTQYAPRVRLGEQVQRLDFNEPDRTYTLRTTGGEHKGEYRGEYRARAVLISAGVGAFTPKTLSIPDARKYEGIGLYYFAKSLDPFRGKHLLIVGGGDSAVDWANTLSPVAGHVTLIHRRDQFRAHEDSVRQMLAGPTRVALWHELRSIGGEGRIESATVYDNRTNAEQTLAVDAVLVNVGFQNSLGPIKDWGLELQGGSIKVDALMRTNRPGVFAAGDVAAFPGKLKLIATGFGEACVAVNHAKQYLDPAANAFPGHSSTMKETKEAKDAPPQATHE